MGRWLLTPVLDIDHKHLRKYGTRLGVQTAYFAVLRFVIPKCILYLPIVPVCADNEWQLLVWKFRCKKFFCCLLAIKNNGRFE